MKRQAGIMTDDKINSLCAKKLGAKRTETIYSIYWDFPDGMRIPAPHWNPINDYGQAMRLLQTLKEEGFSISMYTTSNNSSVIRGYEIYANKSKYPPRRSQRKHISIHSPHLCEAICLIFLAAYSGDK